MHTSKNRQDEQLERAVDSAPGAVAPTGGAVPEDAVPKRAAPGHDLDELVDTLGLLLRAARQLDPERRETKLRALEKEAESVITAIEEIDGTGADEVRHQTAARVAESTRRELMPVIEHTLERLRSNLRAETSPD
ncbi:MAG TPA: hypothetical protein VFQ35_02630 [Polyangiaceae bacterium]|nr:hypothetical protein [Polyangiaceae bacterium]